MPLTEDLVVSLPTHTAQRLRELTRLRGAGSEGDIIVEALETLLDEVSEDKRIAALVTKGFESATWHDPEEVRAALKKRYAGS